MAFSRCLGCTEYFQDGMPGQLTLASACTCHQLWIHSIVQSGTLSVTGGYIAVQLLLASCLLVVGGEIPACLACADAILSGVGLTDQPCHFLDGLERVLDLLIVHLAVSGNEAHHRPGMFPPINCWSRCEKIHPQCAVVWTSIVVVWYCFCAPHNKRDRATIDLHRFHTPRLLSRRIVQWGHFGGFKHARTTYCLWTFKYVCMCSGRTEAHSRRVSDKHSDPL
jgi:hypothetical protein